MSTHLSAIQVRQNGDIRKPSLIVIGQQGKRASMTAVAALVILRYDSWYLGRRVSQCLVLLQ